MTDSTRTGSGDIRTAGEQGNDQGNDQDRDQSVGRWKLIVARRPTHHGHCMAGDRGRGNAGRRQRLLRVERVEQPVADAVIFSVPKGQFVCIIGHSGWGKTTILNVLAGLDQASDGTVIMDERDVVGPSLERGVVFQGHALMPWLSVRRNIAFAVRSKWPDWSRAQVDKQVEKFVDLVGLSGAIQKIPSQLPGDMKQRLGTARAFAIEPKMLLLADTVMLMSNGGRRRALPRWCATTGWTFWSADREIWRMSRRLSIRRRSDRVCRPPWWPRSSP